jgi:hypothetical protein
MNVEQNLKPASFNSDYSIIKKKKQPSNDGRFKKEDF